MRGDELGAVNIDEAPIKEYLAFQRAWLDRYAFDATSYAGESKRGERLLVSDHPEWWPAACPDDSEIVGEAAWTVRTLVNRR